MSVITFIDRNKNKKDQYKIRKNESSMEISSSDNTTDEADKQSKPVFTQVSKTTAITQLSDRGDNLAFEDEERQESKNEDYGG